MSLDSLRGIWKGRTAVCIASGPSLTAEDVERVRGLSTIVVNTSWRIAPWADILFAMDASWWKHYGDDVARDFAGRKFSYVRTGRLGVTPTKGVIYPTGSGNSGSYGVSIAVVTGAERIILLGYDCQMAGERAHWHEDHPRPMSNAGSMPRWPKQFELVATYARSHGRRVVNCSRETALTCFERGTLEDELRESQAA